MIVINHGSETINLVINGLPVAVKNGQACVITEREYGALKKLFPALQPLETQEAATEEVVEEKTVKTTKRKKKAK